MLARSASSRRRRASRSTASSPQRTSTSRNAKGSVASAAAATTAAALAVDDSKNSARNRRASVAVSSGSVPLLVPNRSPRNSISVPQGSENNLLSVSSLSSRGARSSFSASDGGDLLHPDKGSRSARGSFALPDGFSDSLLLPGSGGSRSARGSFSVPDIDNTSHGGSRSARGSFAVPEGSDLLLPPQGTRSARGSFSCPNSEIQISVSGSRSARASFSVPSESQEQFLPMNRSPRGSFALPMDRTPRGSLIPPDLNSSNLNPRNSLIPDVSRSPRGSISAEVPQNRSPRGSIGPETVNRSPRGSIVEYNRSPRGSLVQEHNRSPRGSLGADGLPARSPRTSPRGSIPDTLYSPRGSIAAATFHSSPRGSLDLAVPGSSKGGTNMPNSGSYRLATRGQSNHVDTESRRASSSVSQVSADDRKQLCEQTKLNPEAGAGLRIYGSVVYQLKDANMEASGTCDFVLRALKIVFKTVTVTIILVCLSAIPVVMLILGVNYLKDCPKEPHLPVYMVVGGSFGSIKMLWVIWRQIRSRRYERIDIVQMPSSNYEDTLLTPSAGSRLLSFALSIFLLVWFILGNYWTYRIFFPAFEPASLYEPNSWCSKTLYIFSLVHLGVYYVVILGVLGLTIGLMCCHVFSCSLVVRYK